MIKRKCLKENTQLVWNERIEERRLQILQKQLSMKEQILQEIRASGAEELELSGSKKKKHLERTITKFVKKHRLFPLMQGEYLISDNYEFTGETDAKILKSAFDKNSWNGNDWYLVYRPQGKRVLVISNNMHTFVVEMKAKENNLYTKKFVSVLQSIGGKSQSFTILDAVLNENNEEKKLYILDLIAWNGHYYDSNPVDFRFYWLTQKWREDITDNMYTKDQNVISVELCDRIPLNNYFDNNIDNPSYETDGLYLYHKEGEYVNEVSPFLLVFRTFNNCSYLKDLIQSGIATFKMMYERHESLASVKLGQLEIKVGVLPNIDTKSIVKVKLRLKSNGMEDEVEHDNFEIISIEEDPLCKIIETDSREDYCDTYGKLLFYLSIQNLQNDAMIL